MLFDIYNHQWILEKSTAVGLPELPELWPYDSNKGSRLRKERKKKKEKRVFWQCVKYGLQKSWRQDRIGLTSLKKVTWTEKMGTFILKMEILHDQWKHKIVTVKNNDHVITINQSTNERTANSESAPHHCNGLLLKPHLSQKTTYMTQS